ncbi:hypothetical protein Droror1_Dr00016885 [Drosera rotundifolia]
MELASSGMLSTLTRDGWPLAFGVRCAVDGDGTPVLCQCGVRTPQCTIPGSLEKPQDAVILKKLCSIWKKRLEEEANEDLILVVTVDCVLQIGDFQEASSWKLKPSSPWDVAGRLVNEINTNSMEDILPITGVGVLAGYDKLQRIAFRHGYLAEPYHKVLK